MGVSFGKSVKTYILQYGYLGYGHIELFGINSKQGMQSDMIKETLSIHKYYPVTKDMIAIENQGDGDYYLVDSHDKVYELNRYTEKLVSTGLDFYSYILERFNQTDGSDSAYENFMDILDDSAMEGSNLDAWTKFNSAVESGNSFIIKANASLEKGKYDESANYLKSAKSAFLTGIDEVYKIPDTPLSATIIQAIVKRTLGTWIMMQEKKKMIKFYRGIDNKSHYQSPSGYALMRALFDLAGLVPGMQIAPLMIGGVRRFANTESLKERGIRKKFTFNGFKEDLVLVLNMYVDNIDELIIHVARQKVLKTRDPIYSEN